MFNDETLCYFYVLPALILLVLLIKMWPYEKIVREQLILKYQKHNLLNNEKTIISVKEFQQEIGVLTKENYELTVINELQDFINNQQDLPDKMFMILTDYIVSHPVKMLALEMLKHKKNIIFFNPILQAAEIHGKIIAQAPQLLQADSIGIGDPVKSFLKIYLTVTQLIS